MNIFIFKTVKIRSYEAGLHFHRDDPKTTKTWNSPHLAGIGRNPLEFHVDSVARTPRSVERERPAAVFVKRRFRSRPPTGP